MTHLIRTMSIAAAVLLISAGPAKAAAQQPAHRLSKEDVMTLLQGQVSPHRVEQRVHEQGISFQLTPQLEKELRQAGATGEVIAALREAAPQPEPVRIVVQTTPQAEVYLDDEFRGRASAEGRLVISETKPGGHTLRVAVTGKNEFRETVNVQAGRQNNIDAALSDVERPAPKLVLPPTGGAGTAKTTVPIGGPASDSPGSGGISGAGAYNVGNGVSAPIPIYKPDPPYSDEARKAKYQGTDVLFIVIDASGAVSDCKVVKALGMGLDEQAVKTIRTWKFKPALRNGEPVPVRVMVQVSFRLFK